MSAKWTRDGDLGEGSWNTDPSLFYTEQQLQKPERTSKRSPVSMSVLMTEMGARQMVVAGY